MNSWKIGVLDKVSRQDVLDCYQDFLGRPPESEEVIQVHLRQPNFRRLVKTLLSCEEFEIM